MSDSDPLDDAFWKETENCRHYADTARSTVSSNDTVYAARLCDALAHVEAPICADLACGPGFMLLEFQKEMKRRGKAVGGLYFCDLSEQMLVITREEKERYNIDATVETKFISCGMENVDLPDESVDCVICKFLWNCVGSETALKGAKEAMRCLKPGGILVVIDTFGKTVMSWFVKQIVRLKGGDADEFGKACARGLPIDVIRRIMEDAGFQDQDVHLGTRLGTFVFGVATKSNST